jgi:hypothetical protein
MEALRRADINVSEQVKRFLQDLAWQTELKGRLSTLDKVLEKVPPAQRGFSTKSVREDHVRH